MLDDVLLCLHRQAQFSSSFSLHRNWELALGEAFLAVVVKTRLGAAAGAQENTRESLSDLGTVESAKFTCHCNAVKVRFVFYLC